MTDPFTLVVAKKDKFCNRENEKAELIEHIVNKHNVVLSSKRRIGKTSLVEEVFNLVQNKGISTIYADLFTVSSEKDFVEIMASAIAKSIGESAIDARSFIEKISSLFKSIVPRLEIKPDGASIDMRIDKTTSVDKLMEDVMQGLYNYSKKKGTRIVVCLDEFQEITRLRQSKKIEGTLRSYIQFNEDITFLFAGSRRGILKDMFADKNKPLYKIAYPMTIQEIPRSDFVSYIQERFESTNKTCPPDTAGLIYDHVSGHTYYVQKLASLCWSRTDTICDAIIVKDAYATLLKIEVATELEGLWRGLSLGQRSVMKAIAKEPTRSPYSLEFSSTHGLPIATIRRALDALIKEDYIEILPDGTYTLTNPVFRAWLNNMPLLHIEF